MSIATALGKFGAKAAAKIGMGAAGGGPLGGAIGAGMILLDVIPLIQDLASNGSDPAKLAKLKAVRDGMAQKLVETKGIPMEQALAEVNDQMKPLIDEASQGNGRGPGGTLLDAASVAGSYYLTKRLGAFGGAKKAAAGAAGAAETAAAKEEAATGRPLGGRGSPTPTDIEESNRAAFRAPSAASAAAREPVEPEVLERGFIQVPPDGGTAPMSDDELKQMMIAALLRQQPKRPPGMPPRAAIGAPGA